VRSREGQTVSFAKTCFDNAVLGQTAAAAAAALAACGLDPAAGGQAARRFQPLPHRTQVVATRQGVCFVDDSKATTLSATSAALELLQGPVRLIAGGLLKERDLGLLKEMLRKTVRKAYLIGNAAEGMAAAWREAAPCCICGSLPCAVKQAWEDARAGETILLSPGCASFDQFAGFEERGVEFQRLVRELPNKEV
jgi:UDP-N-acetylmuramoylalanine--D-glutamate ligase